MKPIIQVLGPTGVGKSGVAIQLAKKIDGEIISADSVQVYKDFDIGTDKIGPGQRQGIFHHLIDILADCSQFNASIFLERSFQLAEEIGDRGHIPIVCGGTALYLKTMIKGIFPEKGGTKAGREELRQRVKSEGLSALYREIQEIDPDYAQKIGPNDEIRITRALEIFYNNGLPPSEIFKRTETPFKDYRFIRIGLEIPREELYQRIEARVDRMIERGLVAEVEALRRRYPPDCPPFKSLGYREISVYLDGRMTLPGAITLIKQHSRNFAKRQLSWFRQEKDIHWFSPADFLAIETFVGQQIWKKQSS